MTSLFFFIRHQTFGWLICYRKCLQQVFRVVNWTHKVFWECNFSISPLVFSRWKKKYKQKYCNNVEFCVSVFVSFDKISKLKLYDLNILYVRITRGHVQCSYYNIMSRIIQCAWILNKKVLITEYWIKDFSYYFLFRWFTIASDKSWD